VEKRAGIVKNFYDFQAMKHGILCEIFLLYSKAFFVEQKGFSSYFFKTAALSFKTGIRRTSFQYNLPKSVADKPLGGEHDKIFLHKKQAFAVCGRGRRIRKNQGGSRQ